MKVLFLNDDFYPQAKGGASTIILWLSRELIKRGREVVVVTTTLKENKLVKEKIDDILIYRLPVKEHGVLWRSYFSLYNLKILKQLNTIFVQEKPDVIHAHNLHSQLSYASLKLARKYFVKIVKLGFKTRLNSKVFITMHDVMSFDYGKLFFSPDMIPSSYQEKDFNYKISWLDNLKRVGKAYNPFRNLIIKYYLKYADKIFTVSDALKNALEQNKVSNNMEVIHNGINAKQWDKVDQDEVDKFKNKNKIKSNHKIIFFGGRLSYAKGAGQMLELLAKIRQNIKNIKLLVVGENKKFETQFVAEAEKIDLVNNLIFTGWLNEEQIKLAYKVSDLVVVPSICFDSFPTVILEAFASHKPVVATCLGGAKEIVEDGKGGFIINPFEVGKNSQIMLDLLSNSGLAQQMGQDGYRRLVKEFSLAKQVDKLLKFYEQ